MVKFFIENILFLVTVCFTKNSNSLIGFQFLLFVSSLLIPKVKTTKLNFILRDVDLNQFNLAFPSKLKY